MSLLGKKMKSDWLVLSKTTVISQLSLPHCCSELWFNIRQTVTSSLALALNLAH